MYKAVIFDLDGTLLNTLDDLAAAVNFALRAFSFPQRTTEEIRSFIGDGVVKLMQRSTPENTDSETEKACLDLFRSFYLEHMKDSTRPYEGIEELLSALVKKGVRTAIVSNKLHNAVEKLSKEFFDEKILLPLGVAEESQRKPNPFNVFKAMESFDLSAGECIYVGDSDTDCKTAKNAGLLCVGVTWGFRDEKILRESGADFIAHSPEELLKIIDC